MSGTRGRALLVTASRFGTIGINALVGVCTARALTVPDRGSLALSITLASFLSLVFTAGPDTATLRAGNGPARKAAVGLAFRQVKLTAMAAIVCAALVLTLRPGMVMGLNNTELLVSLGLAPVLTLNQLLGNCVLSCGQVVRWALANVLSISVYAVLALVLFLNNVSFPSAFVVSLGIGYIFSMTLLLRHTWTDRGGFKSSESKILRRAGRATFVTTIVQLLLLRVQLPLLVVLSGPAAAGLLSVSLPITELLLIAPVAISSVLLPEYHESSARADLVATHARKTVYLTALCAIGVAASAPLVPWAYGRDYAGSVWPILVIAPSMIAFAYARVLQSAMFARDHFKPVTVASALALVVSILLQVILSPRYSELGAALAIAGAYITFAAAMGVSFRRLRANA
ncbi:hypothetical protein GCM10022399_31010 [Terrabacter ginsenosidimutans]|uniref:Polysaccharide biosynthesis protein n=1 Tax=Terrabacter ginsenosidimutans TaxID=490575 RepID=A0ABP7E0S6_9MICO